MGFSVGLTGQGEAVRWQVIEDTSAAGGKVIAETSRDTADYRCPLCIYDGAVAGKAGLWTKTDSLTHFAEFAVQPVAPAG